MGSSPQAAAEQRHYGIDALRILSIYMVLVIHILGLGGVLNATVFPEARFFSAWTLEVAGYCAVNCYALITGYVMVGRKYRYTNLVLLWLQVALVNVLGTLLVYFVKPGSVSKVDLLLSFFPVSRKVYWYFSAYFALYLLLPLITPGLNKLSSRQARWLCPLLGITLSLMPTLMNADAFQLGGGYSPLWLMALYIMGACIRKFDFGANIRSGWLLVGYGLSVVLSVGLYGLLHLESLKPLLKVWRKSLLILYTSPTILFNGIALFLLFTRMQFKSQWVIRIIRVLSPLTFGVYILHAQPLIAQFFLLNNQFAPLADAPIPLMIGGVLLSAAGMFVFFGCIEQLRSWLFSRLKLRSRLLSLETRYLDHIWEEQK